MSIEIQMSTKSEPNSQRAPIDTRSLVRMLIMLITILIRVLIMLIMMLIRVFMMLMLTSPVLGQELNKEQHELLQVT